MLHFQISEICFCSRFKNATFTDEAFDLENSVTVLHSAVVLLITAQNSAVHSSNANAESQIMTESEINKSGLK